MFVDRRTVEENQRGARLQDFLASTWPGVPRPFLRSLVETGQVRVNFTDTDGRKRLAPGDVVEVDWPEADLPQRKGDADAGEGDEASPLRILAETESLLVVDKPAGVPSAPDRSGRRLGVLGMLRDQRDEPELRLVHRLDQDTSGCLLFARTLDAARQLDEHFRERRVHKVYLALVEGSVHRREVQVRRALGPDPRRPGKVKTVPAGSKKSREAETEFATAERFRGYTLLQVRPRTGRSHQIRVHAQSIGHPIVADRDYGSRGPLLLSRIKRGYKIRPGVVETPLLARMFLHAERIELPDGSRFRAPLPRDLELALNKLRRFAAVDKEREQPCD